MSLLHCDSFDFYATASLSLRDWITPDNVTIAGGGRNGTSSLRCNDWDENVDKLLNGTYSTLIVGVAWRASLLPAAGATDILTLFSGDSTLVSLRVNSAGSLWFTRNGTQIGSATANGTVSAATFYYLEIKVTLHASAGVAVLRVNEVQVLNGTGLNTVGGTTDRVRFGGLLNTGGVLDFDDLVILDTAGSVNNDFIGDVRVQAILPSGNGNSSVLVGSDGNSTDNYLLVDEATPNGDTDYVASATPGAKDTYAYGNVTPASGSVLGVQISAYARKDDAGARSIVTVARSGGTEADGPVQTLATTFDYHTDVRETKPGGSQWSISDVNGAEFGVKVNA